MPIQTLLFTYVPHCNTFHLLPPKVIDGGKKTTFQKVFLLDSFFTKMINLGRTLEKGWGFDYLLICSPDELGIMTFTIIKKYDIFIIGNDSMKGRQFPLDFQGVP